MENLDSSYPNEYINDLSVKDTKEKTILERVNMYIQCIICFVIIKDIKNKKLLIISELILELSKEMLKILLKLIYI